MENSFITFGKPKFNSKEIKAVSSIIRSGWIGTGKKTKEFEEKFLKYKNAKYGSAVNSCTSALFLSLLLSNIKKNDEVITTALTFCSTINSIIHIGAKPVLVDINIDNLQIDETSIEKKINKNTKAILIVHMHGYSCNMKKILKICKKYNLKLIEDCAHAIESQYFNKHLGTFGDFGCFSFYSNKNITTIEGGMLICKKKYDSKKAKLLSLHGMSKDAFSRYTKKKYSHYDVLFPGYKMNLTDVNACLGILQLEEIEKKRKIRKKIWDKYQKEFVKTKFITPINATKFMKHSYHIYYLRIPKNKKKIRDHVIDTLYKKNIGIGLHYNSITKFSFYKKFFKNQKFKNAEIYANSAISLPLTPYLKNKDVSKIIRIVKSIDREIN